MRRQLERDNLRWPTELREIPREDWPKDLASRAGAPFRVWRSRDFLVQAFRAKPPALLRLSINRAAHNGERWADEISWDNLQRLKREAGYSTFDAIEIFPADADVVNVANMRHLWILAEQHPLTWRKADR